MSEKLSPLRELTLARIREFVREPAAVFWTFGFPVLLAVGLGIAFRSRPPETTAVVLVGTDAALERAEEILRDVENVDVSRVSSDEAATSLRTGKVDLVITGGREAGRFSFTYRYDPMRPAGRTARLVVDAALQRGLGRLDVADVQEETVIEQGGRYIDFLIPGLIGLNIMGSSMWGIGYAVVLARRRKLIKRLAATPMRRSHYMLSYIFSRIVFLLAEVAALVAFGWLVFGVAVHGSFLWLGFVSLLGGISFTGLALLVASRTDSTEVASGLMNAFMLPMWLLSGAFFSYERFPEAVHPVIRALPLTALNDALRAVVNDGAPVLSTLPQVAVLAAWGALGFLLALRLFRWH
ncbi:MAG: ABC transporter permease [Deltaproteobacteria bacterium]|nr:ABC transporter permease [Deltaproteobacteria bacterium]